MKILFVLVLFICSTICYSQTWVERIGIIHGVGDITEELSVITKEQFDRLIQQHSSTNRNCSIIFTNNLELKSFPVISGTRPVFNGYYYLLSRKNGRIYIIYGNSNTGRMELNFYNSGLMQNDVIVNSNEYRRRYNQYINWVNGNN
ncbi:MAG: hypothetical protein FWD13_07350 [Treponema sp.]|nr:hypothetical protein [Treponema sp.]